MKKQSNIEDNKAHTLKHSRFELEYQEIGEYAGMEGGGDNCLEPKNARPPVKKGRY